MHARSVDTPSDSDLRHLADLLDLLPGPDEKRFWRDVNARGDSGELPMASIQLLRLLVFAMPALRKASPTPGEIRRLIHALLIAFGGDPRRLPEVIGAELPFVTGGQPAVIGRLWLDDLIATSWRLYVRHHGDSEERLRSWPDPQWWVRNRRVGS
ncbi:hypothetical protein GCM10009850_111130 [Nonomuraea monospora]|uniref:Uncharacterized protein n=1 Tax=Nonomuraea monospora TaxID=568818 RepID=A0ABP5PX84_9ACTN